MKQISKVFLVAMTLVNVSVASAQSIQRGQIGERMPNDPNVLDICTCADPNMASSPNCQAIIAQQVAEPQRGPASQHMTMATPNYNNR